MKREKPHYIVPVEDPPKYLAHSSKLGVPSARSDPNQIYVVFLPESKFTEEDVLNYFRYCRLTLVFGAFLNEASTCYVVMQL